MASQNDQSAGYDNFDHEFTTLVSSYPPPFIYINDPITPRTTTLALRSILSRLSKATEASIPVLGPTRIHHGIVNAVSCFSARLLYDSILNSLSGWKPDWDAGSSNWTLGGQRWNDSVDGFLHGLRTLHGHLCKGGNEHTRFVIVIERAERLKETLPDLLTPLTRLAELSQLDLSVVFISDVPWEDLRPSLGASPDPYFMEVPPPTKEVIVQQLTSSFSTTSQAYNTALGSRHSAPAASPYHPSLEPLYHHFVSVLCDVCFPFTHDPQELEYIAAARWPGFAQPVLDEHQRKVESLRERRDGMDVDDEQLEEDENEFSPPSEDVRMRLSRLFNPSLTSALEVLYPRLTNASDWAMANQPEPDILAKHPGQVIPMKGAMPKQDESGIDVIPRMSKFILVAAFLASTNPAKSDLRMFGRGLDEKKRKRRANKSAKSGPAKIPQRLLGPAPFPLDRLTAILGALLEENDVDARPLAPEYTVPGEYTDMEIGRTGIYASIMELTSMRLLHRTSPGDKLDGPPMFKCGVSYDVTLAFARQLDIPLNDLMWDPA